MGACDREISEREKGRGVGEGSSRGWGRAGGEGGAERAAERGEALGGPSVVSTFLLFKYHRFPSFRSVFFLFLVLSLV